MNFTAWSQWLHILVVRRCTKLDRSTMITDNTFCESMDDGPGRSIRGREGKSVSGLHISIGGEIVTPMMAWVPSNQPTMKWSLRLEGQARNKTQPLGSSNLCCWAHPQPLSLCHGYAVHGPIEQGLEWLRKEANWHPFKKCVILFAWEVLMSMNMGQNHLHTLHLCRGGRQ